jgi:SAM-dependent methyltransferase
MELPGIGLIEGSWDHRRTADDYLGHVDFRGKRALDVGPANGFFSFEMERRGAEVTALDLGPEGQWDAVPHPYDDPAALRANLRDNVRQVENAFWFAHRTLGSKVDLVYGSVYDTPALVQPVDVALMGNVLQHLRDPFRAIEKVAEAVRDTLIVTEAVWEADEAFLATPGMRLMPSADSPYCNHSWWQVSPASVIEILRLLGFPQLSFQYHQQSFIATATDTRARPVRHFTVTGTRPRALTEGLAGDSDFRIVFPADAWYAEEHVAGHRRRWSSDRRAIISIENRDTRPRVVSIACGLATPLPDRAELRLNGSMLWSGEVVGAPLPVFTMAATLHPGPNTLEVRGKNAPSRKPGGSRMLGIAVYDITLSTDRPLHEFRPIAAGGTIGRASKARGLGYARPARLEDVRDLTSLLREPDAGRARLRGEVARLAALLQESDGDRAARLDQIGELSQRLQQAEADRAARLDQVEELSRLLQESEADRAARLDQVEELSRLLQESEADRAARLDQIGELSQRLQQAEADRAARLDEVAELSRRLEQAEADRAARLDQAAEISQRLQQAEADRAARLDQAAELSELLQQSEADRAARLDQAAELSELLQQSEADRAARLDQAAELSELLQQAEADRAARLDQVEELSRLLQESEADRAARLEVIQNLEARLAGLQARVKEGRT